LALPTIALVDSSSAAGPWSVAAPRQPLLWVALAAGTVCSGLLWRPVTWWFAGVAVFLFAAAFWNWHRSVRARVAGLVGIAGLAMVAAQLRAVPSLVYPFPADSDVVVSGHVVAEGEVVPSSRGGLRQRLDVVADAVDADVVAKDLTAGIRVLVAVGLGYVSSWVARIPAVVSGWALAGITGTVRGLGGLRLADLRVPTPELWVVIVTGVSQALAMLLARARWRWTGLGLAALVTSAVCIGWGETHPRIRRGVLEMTSIDVGEGDSSLIVTPEGKTLLIDAGGPTGGPHLSEFDVGENVVSPYLWWRGFRRLDAVALTHAHSDHMGGMGSVLRNFRPEVLWLSVIPPSDELAKLLEEAGELGIRVEQHFDDDEFRFGGAEVRVLAPAREWVSFHPSNNDSLVLKIGFGGTSVLMEGDAEALSETRMVGRDPSAALWKVGHHGSKTSATPEFLAAVHPRYGVISVGRGNLFGLPKVEVLRRLEGVGIYRTDMVGAVSFFLDGWRVIQP
jgi:competence protein ComEC